MSARYIRIVEYQVDAPDRQVGLFGAKDPYEVKIGLICDKESAKAISDLLMVLLRVTE